MFLSEPSNNYASTLCSAIFSAMDEFGLSFRVRFYKGEKTSWYDSNTLKHSKPGSILKTVAVQLLVKAFTHRRIVERQILRLHGF